MRPFQSRAIWIKEHGTRNKYSVMRKYGFIYLWRDNKRHKYYLGSHWGTENDRYICGNKHMRDNRRYRPWDFKRRVLKRVYINRADLYLEEQRWLDMIRPDEFCRKYYNISAKVGQVHWSSNEETKRVVKEKIRQTKLKKHHIPVVRTYEASPLDGNDFGFY